MALRFLLTCLCVWIARPDAILAGENRWTPAGPPERIVSLTGDGSNPGSLYALTAAGIYRSDDLGESWSLVDSVVTSAVARNLLAYPKGTGVVWAVGCGAFESASDGTDWTRIEQGLPADCSLSTLAVDPTFNCCPFRPYDLFAGGASGLYRTSFTSSGPVWNPIAQGVVKGPALLAVAQGRAFAAPLEGGFLYSDDRGESWITRAAPSGVRISALAPLPRWGNLGVVATTDQGLYETLDAGQTWAPDGDSLRGISVNAVLLSDRFGHGNYAATDHGLYRDTGAGPVHSWVPFSDGLPEGLAMLYVFSDQGGRHLYASSISGDQSFVYRYGNPSIAAQMPVQTVFVNRYSNLPFTISPPQPGDFTLEVETFDPSVISVQPGFTAFANSSSIRIQTLRATGVPVTITARVPAELGASQASWQVTVVNPPSTADELSPSSIPAGSPGLTIRVFDEESGSSFVAGSTIYWNGSPRATREKSSPCAYICTYSRWLEADIDAADLASPGYATVTVVNPAPGGGASKRLTFTIGPGANRAPIAREGSPPGAPRAKPFQ